MVKDSIDPDLLFWRGHLERDPSFLRLAIQADATHIDSRLLLINWTLELPWYATHHLPEEYFIGDPNEALKALTYAEELLHSSLPEERTKMFREEIDEYRRLTNDYLLRSAITNNGEQNGADLPTTAPESKSEGKNKPKPESEGRPQ
ncbi:MAG: hypothetical protein AAGA96_19400 [Verrucomicrobiota bacterium]